MVPPTWEAVLQLGFSVAVAIVLLWAMLATNKELNVRLRESNISYLSLQGLMLVLLYRKRYDEEMGDGPASRAKECERCQADYAEVKRILEQQRVDLEKAGSK